MLLGKRVRNGRERRRERDKPHCGASKCVCDVSMEKKEKILDSKNVRKNGTDYMKQYVCVCTIH